MIKVSTVPIGMHSIFSNDVSFIYLLLQRAWPYETTFSTKISDCIRPFSCIRESLTDSVVSAHAINHSPRHS